MRELLLLILVFGLCVALDETPVTSVMEHNIAIADTMMGNPALTTDPVNKENESALNLTIVTVLPSVDMRMPPETVGVLWAWNEDYVEGEVEDCNFTLNNKEIVYLYMNFTFRNESRVVDGMNESEPIIEIPFAKEELDAANGTEVLEIILDGKWRYNFTKKCEGEPWEIGIIRDASSSHLQEYLIESGNASFFLARPVLGEQWYQNNHFDILVFSRKSIYGAEISLDGNASASAQIYNFSVVEDELGAEHVLVNRTSTFENSTMENYEIAYWANPVVQENNSFSHLYEVNYTYAGWGAHALNITVRDFFGGSYSFEKEIFSRKMTYQGKSESGEESGGDEHYRPSAPQMEEGKLEHRIIPSSDLLLLFLVAAVGAVGAFWYYKGGGKSR